jgi:hypothetical protein
VYEFTINGHLKSTFKVSEMGHLAGLTVTNCGLIVLCSLDKSDKLGIIAVNPASILICESYKSKDCNYIKEYNLK